MKIDAKRAWKYLVATQDESLAEHDARYHDGHFEEGKESCNKRDKMAKDDKGDNLSGGQEDPNARTTKLAPNGKRSNLTNKQYAQVRTPEFKAWFGDWENDPANASKVVDENGEPRVVYHGTYWDPTKEQDGKAAFSKSRVGSNFDVDYANNFFFTASRNNALGYGDKAIPVYLNIRKPALGNVLIPQEGFDDSSIHESLVYANDFGIAEGYNESEDFQNADGKMLRAYYENEDEGQSAMDDLKDNPEYFLLNKERESFIKKDETLKAEISLAAKTISDTIYNSVYGKYVKLFGEDDAKLLARKFALSHDPTDSSLTSRFGVPSEQIAKAKALYEKYDVLNKTIDEYSRKMTKMRKEAWDSVIKKTFLNQAMLFAVDESSQIKSATDNSGAFNPNDPDIRH